MDILKSIAFQIVNAIIELHSEVDDYHLLLIIPAEIKDFSKFKTELGKAMKYIAVSEDKEAVKELEKDEEFKEIGIEIVRLINECTGSNIDVSEKRGGCERV